MAPHRCESFRNDEAIDHHGSGEEVGGENRVHLLSPQEGIEKMGVGWVFREYRSD
jgi:hypothetical protein